MQQNEFRQEYSKISCTFRFAKAVYLVCQIRQQMPSSGIFLLHCLKLLSVDIIFNFIDKIVGKHRTMFSCTKQESLKLLSLKAERTIQINASSFFLISFPENLFIIHFSSFLCI